MRYPVVIVLFLTFFSIGLAAQTSFSSPFSNGSPPCTSCHSIMSAGFSGKTMGPDLSTFFYDMGKDAASIKSFIRDSGITVMDAVYKGKGLSENELDELVTAFSKLQEEVSEPNGSNYIVYSVAVFLLLLVFLKLLFKKNTLMEENL